jgi:hypothetical protein
MRMPRMTTRRWMIAAAVVALLITAAQTGRRWMIYRKLTSWHERQALDFQIQELDAKIERAEEERRERQKRWKRHEQLSLIAGEWEANPLAKQPVYLRPVRSLAASMKNIRADRTTERVRREPSRAEEAGLLAAYHARLTQKYRLAASRPWMYVPPDPIPPKP